MERKLVKKWPQAIHKLECSKLIPFLFDCYVSLSQIFKHIVNILNIVRIEYGPHFFPSRLSRFHKLEENDKRSEYRVKAIFIDEAICVLSVCNVSVASIHGNESSYSYSFNKVLWSLARNHSIVNVRELRILNDCHIHV